MRCNIVDEYLLNTTARYWYYWMNSLRSPNWVHS